MSSKRLLPRIHAWRVLNSSFHSNGIVTKCCFSLTNRDAIPLSNRITRFLKGICYENISLGFIRNLVPHYSFRYGWGLASYSESEWVQTSKRTAWMRGRSLLLDIGARG